MIEKPRVVYSSAPVINKPEKKKKKKKEEEGGPQADTGDQSKGGPSGGIVPAMMPVPQPEVKVHEPIHVSYVYVGKRFISCQSQPEFVHLPSQEIKKKVDSDCC